MQIIAEHTRPQQMLRYANLSTIFAKFISFMLHVVPLAHSWWGMAIEKRNILSNIVRASDGWTLADDWLCCLSAVMGTLRNCRIQICVTTKPPNGAFQNRHK